MIQTEKQHKCSVRWINLWVQIFDKQNANILQKLSTEKKIYGMAIVQATNHQNKFGSNEVLHKVIPTHGSIS